MNTNSNELYTKLPNRISKAMRKVSMEGIYHIPLLDTGDENLGLFGQCHNNVAEMVERFGGKQVTGFYLDNTNLLMKNGGYLWHFHSVWESPEGKLIDVTSNPALLNRKVVFLKDCKRLKNLRLGISFNSIIAFTNDDFARHVQSMALVSPALKRGNPYWTTGSLNQFRKINKSGNVYLLKGFPNNERLLEQRYGLITNGSNISLLDLMLLPPEAHFDFLLPEVPPMPKVFPKAS